MPEINPELFAEVPAWVFRLPPVNACLNGLATVLLVCGWILIRRERKRAHAACMIAALVVSAAFLTCYLVYHFSLQAHAEGASIPFTHEGWIRPVYFAILISHILLAIINLPLILLTVIPAAARRFAFHRRVARWTLPSWLYVSVTGVLVYLMLYVWFPSDVLAHIPGRG